MLTVSPTSISALQKCQRFWKLRYVDRFEPVVKAQPLLLGAAFAAALEANDQRAGVAYLDEQRQQQQARRDRDAWAPEPMSVDAHRVSCATVEAAAIAYFLSFDGSAERREVTLHWYLDDCGASVTCRIDAIDAVDGSIIEDKFVSRFSPDGYAGIMRQLDIEAYMLDAVEGTTDPRKIKLREIKKPTIRQRRDESVDEFCGRIRSQYLERPAGHVKEAVTTRGDHSRKETETALRLCAEQMKRIVSTEESVKNTDACLRFGKCEFFPLCTGEPGADAQFQVRTTAAEARNTKRELERFKREKKEEEKQKQEQKQKQ